MKQLSHLLFLITYLSIEVDSKYLEGVLETSNNWAFLARFCFLSKDGQFEYYLEFNENEGTPNLLLYYDTEDQWPAVYGTSKSCYEKESVLDMGKSQIINLTAINSYYREFSGCSIQTEPIESLKPAPKYTLQYPTLPTKLTTTIPSTIPEKTTFGTTTNTEIYEQSSTFIYDSTFSILDDGINLTTMTVDSAGYSTTTALPPSTSTEINSKKRPKRTPIGFFGSSSNGGRKQLKNGRQLMCHHARRFRSARERWWFIAISNCKSTKGIHVKYRILMTNGPPGDYWHEHFSADEFYILPVLMAFSIAYSLLLLAIIACSIELKSRQLLHTTYKVFVFSVLSQFVGVVFASSAYLKYAVSGLGPGGMKRTGTIFMAISETLFLLLLLLLAKGYTVTRGRLPLTASVKLTVFMCLYVVTYITIFIYEANVFDPGEVLYLYESPAGYGLITLRVLAWCMFIYSTIFTLKHYPEKSTFYYPFNVCATLWFIAGPAFILSANTYIDKWVRESVVCGVLQFITFGGHLMFLILTMPSVANKNFPYHVRTTQIGCATNHTTNGGVERFGHHMYEPSGDEQSSSPKTVIVPLTRRTEEIFEGVYNQTSPRQRQSMSTTLNNEDTNFIEHRNGTSTVPNDVVMENVLGWSLAKNLNAAHTPRNHLTILASANGFPKPEFNNSIEQNGRVTVTPPPPPPLPPSDSNTFDDYVRDVPVELFTVSRMVVSHKNHDK